MDRSNDFIYGIFFFCLLSLMSCGSENYSEQLSLDQVHEHLVSEVRLGDGVPLDLNISIRWNVRKPSLFLQQFATTDTFNQLILTPRLSELSSAVATQFASVDSVFSADRTHFKRAIKNKLLGDLGEEHVEIKEIIFSKIHFPSSYTQAMEKRGLMQQEMERIEVQNQVDIEKAEAAKKRNEAEAKVQIAQAKADAEIQKIKAETEETRRKTEMALAKTRAEVLKLEAAAKAEEQRLLAKADLDKKRDLKDLDIQKKRELNRVELDRVKAADQIEFDAQLRFAQLCSENPVYASFLVNKELASKVEIAVLPTGSDPNVFGSVLKNTMTTKN